MNALVVNSSGRTGQSVSRQLVDELLQELKAKHPDLQVKDRDAATGLPFVNDLMIGGFYIPDAQRTAEQRDALAFSDQLVAELLAADVLVLGVPIYNFGIPAALKAWIDLIARAGLTFRYSEAGPEGLVKGKRAYLVVASAGTEVGSSYDLATPYLKLALGFIGITDVHIISAEKLALLGEQPLSVAREAIRQIHAEVA